MRRTLRFIGIAVALLLVALVSLPFLIGAGRFKPVLESKLSAALGRQVTIGNLSLSLLAGGVKADALAIADDPAFGSSPFLKAGSLKVGVQLWPLIVSRKLNVTGIAIDQPEVALLQSATGRWNYSSLGGGAGRAAQSAPAGSAEGSLDLSVKLVRISGGRFSIGKAGGRQQPLTLEDVNLEVREFSPSAAFPLSFRAKVTGGGEIGLEGKAGPIDATDAQLTPLSFTLEIAKLNLAAVLAGTAPGVAGTASLKAEGASSAGRLTLSGKLKAENLKLAKNGKPARRTVELDIAAAHDLRQRSGTLQRGNLHVGAALASLTGTYAERGEATVLDMKFAGTKMPVPELAELLPPLGIALPNGSKLEGGTATASFTIDGPADRIVAAGAVSLDNTRLANFDLGTKMTLIETLAGIKHGPNTDIETLTAKAVYTPQGTTLEGLRFVAKDIGELSGRGTVSAANALDLTMKATVQTSRSAALSKTAVPFFIQGTAMDPVFKPDVHGLVNAQVKSQAEKLKGSAGSALGGLFRKRK
jgi:AsmA protein